MEHMNNIKIVKYKNLFLIRENKDELNEQKEKKVKVVHEQ